MKYIITENRLNNIVTQWLDDNYGDLELEKTPHYIFFKKNGTYIFDYGKSSGIVTVIDEVIQNTLISVFNIDSNVNSLNKILIPWFKERYNIKPKEIIYTTWYCTKCGRYHITKDHVE